MYDINIGVAWLLALDSKVIGVSASIVANHWLYYMDSDRTSSEVHFCFGQKAISTANSWYENLESQQMLPATVRHQWQPKNPDYTLAFEDCRRKQVALLKSQGKAISRKDQESPGKEFWARKDLPHLDILLQVEVFRQQCFSYPLCFVLFCEPFLRWFLSKFSSISHQ